MYIPLYVKSNYSLLSSLLKIDDIINYAISSNLEYCTINDCNMYAVMEFVKKCDKNNIKPIISLSVTINENEFVLFAKDYDGYKSLIKISTIISKNSITYNGLNEYKKSLLAVIPYKSLSLYEDLKEIYDDIYLGYSNLQEEKEVSILTSNILFFRESLYLNKSDFEYLKYLYLIRDGKTVIDEMDYDLFSHELNIENIMSLSSNKGLSNTFEVALKCNVVFPKSKLLLPIYDNTKNMKEDEYLFELAKAGLNKRLENKISDDYKERLSYELNIINNMGFSNYFLVVYDFIKFAKKNGILVGPGRGSAAGSLVSYALGITDIDPLKYDLLFERFLNPERKTMPDIDTDFPDDRRSEVIDYVVKKYGEKNVSGIVTFGTLGTKQVIRDVCRILNIPNYKVDRISKMIPSFTREHLKDFYIKDKVFKSRIDGDRELNKMYEVAQKIEGFPRQISTHAAGIVMSQIQLDEVIPLTYSDGMYLTGYSMEYLEDLGLLKMDFLGLKNLTIISNIIKDIKLSKNIDIDFSQIPFDDKDAIEVFTNAATSGIFQFESNGMRNFLLKLQPNCFEDIFAAIALFRPGPAQNIDTYIKRKHGEEKVVYLDPCLEPILKNTYGIMIYQEQIMEVAKVFAGYTLGEADNLRRAISKKKIDLLKSEEERFIRNSIKMGRDKVIASKMFNLILKFAGYGFNRSHSVAYSIIAYKMAYLKVHYRYEFFANLLTSVIGSEVKTSLYIEEARSNDIKIEKPDINISSDRYIVYDDKIIYPLSNLKSIGTVAATTILEARGKEKFKDIYDAFSRLIIKRVTRKNLEYLVLSGCFNSFGINRKTLFYNLDSLINYAELTKDLDPSLVMKPEIEEFPEYNDEQILEYEKDIYGFYFTHHPTTKFYKDNPNSVRINTIKTYFDRRILLLVLVEFVKVIETKKKEKMCFITGSDETGKIDIILFPKMFVKFNDITKGNILRINGIVEKRFSEYKVVAEEIDKLV